jgi:transposase-like protein
VKRRTKKKYTAEDKIRIVLEGMKREVPVAELCRREGIQPEQYESWLDPMKMKRKDIEPMLMTWDGGKLKIQRVK